MKRVSCIFLAFLLLLFTACTRTRIVDKEPKTEKIYEFEGEFIDCIADGNVIHVLSISQYHYRALDATTGEPLKEVSLDSRPEDLHIVGDELWISYP